MLYYLKITTFLSFLISLNAESNNTDYNYNITSYSNDSSIDEISSCENNTSLCYSQSTELTSEFSIFTNEEVTSAVYKETTAIDNVTSIPSTIMPEIQKETKKTLEENCFCDVNENICDINCCCDKDCNKYERIAFSACFQSSPTPTNGKCVTTDIIYTNNTPYPVTRNVDGFLCISRDNYPERNDYVDQEVIESIQIFEKIWKRKRHFSWIVQEKKQTKQFEKADFYKYGDMLWQYNNSTAEITSKDFPVTINSNICQGTNKISYLKNIKNSCLQLVPRFKSQCIDNEDFNARKYCQDLTFISSPSFENVDDSLVKVQQLLCKDYNCEEVTSYPEPEYDAEKSTCYNVVNKVHLIIKHNGSIGITEATCRISLSTLTNEQKFFKQHFEVEYLPARANMSTIFIRSGTPGYRPGLPVIVNLVKGSEGKVRSSLTVISGEDCAGLSPVLFRENLQIQCSWKIPLNYSGNCTQLEEKIISKMLQGLGEVGVTGDPSSWLEQPSLFVATSVARSECKPVSALHLDFLFAYKGSLMKSEAKIVGLLTKFDNHQKPKCYSEFCKLNLVTVVSFTDISKPAASKYASAPVVKIKLPQDFFYPFTSSKSSTMFNIQCLFCIATFVVLFREMFL